jgi:ribosome assembly protein 1
VLIQETGTKENEYLINVVDSPGHVDFSSEVTTAARLCDGAIVLIDVVEGICTQVCSFQSSIASILTRKKTHTVLLEAYLSKIRPILVLNKFDRLITELKLTPYEAYEHLNKILEQANAIMAGFYANEQSQEDYERYLARKQKKEQEDENGEEEIEQLERENDINQTEEDPDIFFSPETGNVIFASAIDRWAFR